MVSKEELLEPLPYAVQAINFFSKFVPICIATSDNRENTIEMVEYLNIQDKIKCIVTSDEVEKGKPDADILFKIAETLNIEPQKLFWLGTTKSM